MKQLTKDQAIALHDGGEWKDWTLEEVAKFQLFQSRLCVPFELYHQAVEHVLERPVWTHEFAYRQSLINEYLGEKDPPTFEEIINLIPEEKRIVLCL